ncbi:MAG TPA: nucleotide-binding domain containing protein, partial [Geminicoccaceae bacterium]|nr:nucleotide-binding domain containing protein [Geminicoccaceae bacterium]
LADIGTASADLALIGGGSGLAMGLPDNFRRAGLLADTGPADARPRVDGLAAVLAGSCSEATLGQIAAMAERRPHLALDPRALARDPDGEVGRALAWAEDRISDGPVLIASSAAPARVREIQAQFGRAQAGALVEDAMAAIARGLVERGVRRLVVAGGETSGAVVNALGVTALRIGPPIDPGVPWTTSLGEPTLALALKSGNFGARDFFLKAFERLP